tara:strand:+ start:1622 stop:2296 length:675 start_codon:yes stop_codon:yes gene_type:complete
MKIGVLMWCDEHTAKKYGNISYQINKLYCDKHGYDLIFSSKRRQKRDELPWEKIPMVIEYIDKYDYTIWIDTDAHFYIDKGPLEDIIKQCPGAHFIFSEDQETVIASCYECYEVRDRKSSHRLNSGIFIVKNTKEARQILTKWAYDDTLYSLQRANWEQGVLQEMWKTNMLNINDLSVIIPYGILQNFSKKPEKMPYIRHFAGTFKTSIKQTFETYFNEITIAR